ncbi:MAG: CBS domain-containing protein, partial [Cyanobacteriota bacterium]|nr:CBS domain-containing protein [Cyanobacteriota bacterium]
MLLSNSDSSTLLSKALDTAPTLVSPETLVLETVSLMSQTRISYVLVVEDERLMGIFTERDVVRVTSEEMDLTGVTIEQLMRPNVNTIRLDEKTDIFEILAQLRAARIRHLPAVDDAGRVVGVITPHSLRQALNPADMLQIRQVSSIMVPKVTTASPSSTVNNVARLMAQQRKSCVVICEVEADENNDRQKPIGIVTERDIVQFKTFGLDFCQTPAREVMSSPLRPVQKKIPLWEAHQIMQNQRIRRLVVVDEDGYLAGIITQTTLLEAINPVDLNSTVELLQQTVDDKTKALRQANSQMQEEVSQRIEAEAQVRRLNKELQKRVREQDVLIDALNQHQQRLYKLNQAYERFVPRQFLQLLHKRSIIDVELGDRVQEKMSILFCDIRSFTSLSEKMTPEDNFRFINAYLSRMEPAILDNGGFIDKYLGDAIMALFGRNADDAVQAGIAMLDTLNRYNQTRQHPDRPPIRIGIGINTGDLMLGTVGGRTRMDGTVISDAVNLASRLEGLTKNYGVSLLISDRTFLAMKDRSDCDLRLIDRVQVKGKSEMVS